MYWIKKLASNGDAHMRALFEVLTVTAFSLLLFVAPYLVKISRTAGTADATLVERGQFFLLSYGVYGTIFWLAFVRWDRARHSARVLLGVLATFAVIPVIAFIGVDPTFKSVINAEAIRAGYWLYVGFLFINYLLLFYLEIEPPDPEKVLADGAKQMAAEYKELPGVDDE